MISLLAPLFLAGLAAAAVPVVIHLIHRRQTRVLPIGTLRFLRLIPAKTIRKHRLEEYILLAARVLFLVLLALAGARPVLREAAAAGGATATAIVLDDSWSMNLTRQGITRLAVAREAVHHVLRTLSDGDRAALIPASDPGAETLSTDLQSILRRAAAAEPSSLAPTLLAASRKGMELLREAREPNRELVLVTDLQRRSVEPLIRGLARKAEDEAIRVLLVDCGVEGAGNVSLARVRAGTGVAVAGERVSVAANIRNSSSAAATVKAYLALGEDRIASTTVSVGPGRTETVPLAATVETPGVSSGRVEIDADDLADDDVRYFALEVMGKIPVLLVNGDPSPVPYEDEVFFLRAALAPEELGAREIEGPVRLKTVGAAAFADEDLSPYRVVIVANLERFPAATAGRLKSFVFEGGGLLLFTGSRVDPGDWNERLGTSRQTGLLPAVLAAAPQPGRLLRLTKAIEDHPLFSGLPAEALADLDRIHVRRALGANPAAGGGEVAAGLDLGFPLIVTKSVGRGQVVLVNTSADADWGNLPLRPLFLPLLHRAIRLLAGRGDERDEHLLGTRIHVPGQPSDPPEVTDPGGEVTRPTRTSPVTGDLVYGPLTIPGVYRVRAPRPEDSFSFAANVDPAEGNLARASKDMLAESFGPERFQYLTAGSDLPGTLSHSREGRPLWGHLLFAALLLLLFESWFANRVARRRAREAA